MTSRNKNDIETSLQKKGFKREIHKKNHIVFRYFSSDGKKRRIITLLSHSGKSIGDPLLSQMARQCKLSKKEFLNLVDCTLNGPEYEEILKEKEEI